eukprot:TRINITY_DN380_c0_g1_i1.p1 TRINITY_DN380_c0_g1~~TRINITY_DN380_c0_g1_i1.p1  ORF type:complete len:360 (+),score=137.30 TRINITY_DN380_c0_g1_i1:57-1136(+)
MLNRLNPLSKNPQALVQLNFMAASSYALYASISGSQAEEVSDVHERNDEEINYLASLAQTELKKLKKKKDSEKNRKKIALLEAEIERLEGTGVVFKKEKIGKVVEENDVVVKGKKGKDKLKGKKGKEVVPVIAVEGSEVVAVVAVEGGEVDISVGDVAKGKGKKLDDSKLKKGKGKKGKKLKENVVPVEEVLPVETPSPIESVPVLGVTGEQVNEVEIVQDKKGKKLKKSDKKEKKVKEPEVQPEFKVLYLGQPGENSFESVNSQNNYIMGQAKFQVGANDLLAGKPCSTTFSEAVNLLSEFEQESLFAKYNLSVCYLKENKLKNAAKLVAEIKPSLEENEEIDLESLDNYLQEKLKKK